MKTVVVTDQNQKWFEIPDATVLTARRYLAEPESGNEGTVRVLNLCRTGRYQGRGYYVSLLAEARGQRPVPGVKTIEDLRSEAYVRALEAEIQPLVQETLHHDESERFQLDVYLGKHPESPGARRATVREGARAAAASAVCPRRRKLAPRCPAGHGPCGHSAAGPRVPARGGQVVHGRKLGQPSGRAQRGAGRDWPSSGTRTNRTSPPTRKRCSGS